MTRLIQRVSIVAVFVTAYLYASVVLSYLGK